MIATLGPPRRCPHCGHVRRDPLPTTCCEHAPTQHYGDANKPKRPCAVSGCTCRELRTEEPK